jgi:hypothetical protein
MPEQPEVTTCSSLSVTVSNLRWSVTEGVLHQVFDAYGAGNISLRCSEALMSGLLLSSFHGRRQPKLDMLCTADAYLMVVHTLTSARMTCHHPCHFHVMGMQQGVTSQCHAHKVSDT